MPKTIRWRKIWRDLWLNKARSILVLLAMITGVFGIGMVADAYPILLREMDENYQRTSPASATIYSGPLTDNLVQGVRELPEITEAEARRLVKGRVQVVEDRWIELWLFVVRDFNDLRLDTFEAEAGHWPPAAGEILLERTAMSVANAEIGDSLMVSIPGVPAQELALAGTAHAPGLPPAWMENIAFGFIDIQTLEFLGAAPELNELNILVSKNADDKEAIRQTAYDLKTWLEANGTIVYRIDVPEPNEHPHAGQMATLLFLLEAFGLLSLILSSVLVATMITALFAQQIRQIGVMKALGGRARQISGMYVGMVLVLGVIALCVGMPLAMIVGRWYATFAAQMLNFEIFSDYVPASTFVLQAAVGLLVPLVVAAYPIYRGSRITVQEALSDYGIDASTTGNTTQEPRFQNQSIFDKLKSKYPLRPFLLSLRNTFRRRGRLILTLGTLSAGGAVFLVAMNATAAMNTTVASRFDSMRFDIQIGFNQVYPVEKIEKLFDSIPEITHIETWNGGRASLLRPDGLEGDGFMLLATPNETELMTPLPMIEGRWLQPVDKNILVVNHALQAEQSEFQVGREVTLRINGQTSTWIVAGVAREFATPPRAYTNLDYYTALTDQEDLAKFVVAATIRPDDLTVTKAYQALEKVLSENDFDIRFVSRLSDQRKVIEDHLKILAFFLIIMSVMALIVGGLGLATTTSINVLERRREIGVLRAIGASSRVVLQIIVIEGILIGLLSWVIAVLISWPLGNWISYNFGMIFFETPLDFAVSPFGFVIWLGLVIFFAGVASFFPAWNASRLTVTQVLAYE